MCKAEVTALGNLYTASNTLRRTFILKAEKLNLTCNDMALASRGQTGSRLDQTDSLLTRTYLSVVTILSFEYVM